MNAGQRAADAVNVVDDDHGFPADVRAAACKGDVDAGPDDFRQLVQRPG